MLLDQNKKLLRYVATLINLSILQMRPRIVFLNLSYLFDLIYPYITNSDPCEDVTCNYGANCELTPQGHPVCLCSTVCFEELSVEKKVCGTNGQTYSSRCAMEKASCEEQREIRVATTGPCGNAGSV